MEILVIIDPNNGFVSGSLGTKEAQAAIPNMVERIEEYKKKKSKIIVTQDTHNSDYLNTPEGKKLPIVHCKYGTWDWEIDDNINKVLNGYPHIVILKGTFGTFKLIEIVKKIIRNTNEKIEKIEVIGLCTDICVIVNVLLLKTAFPNIDIIVNSSCCAGVTPELHEAALKVMQSCQVDVIKHV